MALYTELAHRAHVTAGRLGHDMTTFDHGMAHCKDCHADMRVGVSRIGTSVKGYVAGPALKVKCVGARQEKMVLQ